MKLLDEKHAAESLGCTVATLRKWRRESRGPAYFRVGRLVRYGLADLEGFLNANRIESTVDPDREAA